MHQSISAPKVTMISVETHKLALSINLLIKNDLAVTVGLQIVHTKGSLSESKANIMIEKPRKPTDTCCEVLINSKTVCRHNLSHALF